MKLLVKINIMITLVVMGFSIYKLLYCYISLKYHVDEYFVNISSPVDVLEYELNDFISYLYVYLIYFLLSIILSVYILFKLSKRNLDND